MFDPYRKWLGIPEDQRPPTHYQILGIVPDEQDIDVIEAAVLRQSAFVRNFQSGQHAADATKVLNEIAAARLCLVDRKKRAKYDAELRQKQASVSAPPARARDSGTMPRVTPAAQPQPRLAPALDLDQFALPIPQRAAAVGRRLPTAGTRKAGRRTSSQTSTGYIWQVPLLTVIIVILILFARLIGGFIAERRAVPGGHPVKQATFEEESR